VNSSAELPNHDGQTAFLLTQVGTQSAAVFADLVAGIGLTPPHAGLLRAIAFEPGRSQQEISAQLGLLASRMVALVDDLEASGLVERRRGTVDRRVYALTMTEAGQQKMREIGRVAQSHGADVLTPLSRAERATLHDLLTRLADHHGLAPGVHPGYRSLGRPEGSGRRTSSTDAT
jgi:DNA-binding MarR family transcriptional regulator